MPRADQPAARRSPAASHEPARAARSHPAQYVCDAILKDGDTVTIRPIRPDDEAALVPFHEGLSDQTVYLRYFHMMNLTRRVDAARLRKACRIDDDREMALVAVRGTAGPGEPELMGVARLHRDPGAKVGEFSVVVADRFQGIGLGTALMRRLIHVARAEGLTRIQADVLSANVGMQRMCASLGIAIEPTGDPQLVRAGLTL